MKKMVKLVGIIAFIAVIGFSMAACSNGTTGGNKGDETDPCENDNHYLPRSCHTQEARGFISEYETNVQIPIYQTVGVTDEQAITATGNIIAAYNILSLVNRQTFRGRIKEIKIVTGVNGSDKIDTQYIISINMNASDEDIEQYLYDFAPTLK